MLLFFEFSVISIIISIYILFVLSSAMIWEALTCAFSRYILKSVESHMFYSDQILSQQIVNCKFKFASLLSKYYRSSAIFIHPHSSTRYLLNCYLQFWSITIIYKSNCKQLICSRLDSCKSSNKRARWVFMACWVRQRVIVVFLCVQWKITKI